MLIIDVELLNGAYRATQFDDRSRPEWPPHPARLFYAAVDAVFGGSDDGPDQSEVDALYAWEALGAPSVTCSDERETGDARASAWLQRADTTHFVAGNSATSHRRSLNALWSKIEEGKRAVLDATDSKSLTRATSTLDKLNRDFAKAVEAVTKSTGPESQSAAKQVMRLLPDNRGRQPRTFPVVTPDQPSFSFSWGGSLSSTQRSTLDKVLARIARVGHSSSLVSCHITDESRRPTWVPAEQGTATGVALRTVEPGVLDVLRESYARHRGCSERTMRAEVTAYRRYSEPPTVVPRQDGIGDWIVLRLGQNKLPMSRTQDIARAVRNALIAHADEPVAPVISGHGADGRPTPHLGVVVLPNVTNPRSDGLIQAVAVSLPAGIDAAEQAAVRQALMRWADGAGTYELRLPGGLTRVLERAEFDSANAPHDGGSGRIARRGFWAGAAYKWSTVTPVVLDRHPKVKASADFDTITEAVAPIVADMCERVGLPRPISVDVSSSPVWPTAPVVGRSSNSRTRLPLYRVGGDGPAKFTTHIGLTFAERVGGPIILGAGRFFGYGLFYPTPKGVTP